VLCVVALVFRARWIQIAAALILAGLLTYFMAVTTNVVVS